MSFQKIPTETLINIFQKLAESKKISPLSLRDTHSRRVKPSIAPSSSVCRSWRNAIADTSSLWMIRISMFSSSLLTPSLVAKYRGWLLSSQNCDLELVLVRLVGNVTPSEYENFEDIFRLVGAYYPQWMSLSLSLDARHMDIVRRCFEDLFHNTGANVQLSELALEAQNPFHLPPPTSLSFRCSNVSSVWCTAHCIVLDGRFIVKNLERLMISVAIPRSWADMHDLLGWSPYLTRLYLTIISCPDRFQGCRQVCLKGLRTMTLTLPMSRIHLLFASLDLPSLKNLDITSNEAGRVENFATVVKLPLLVKLRLKDHFRRVSWRMQDVATLLSGILALRLQMIEADFSLSDLDDSLHPPPDLLWRFESDTAQRLAINLGVVANTEIPEELQSPSISMRQLTHLELELPRSQLFLLNLLSVSDASTLKHLKIGFPSAHYDWDEPQWLSFPRVTLQNLLSLTIGCPLRSLMLQSSPFINQSSMPNVKSLGFQFAPQTIDLGLWFEFCSKNVDFLRQLEVLRLERVCGDWKKDGPPQRHITLPHLLRLQLYMYSPGFLASLHDSHQAGDARFLSFPSLEDLDASLPGCVEHRSQVVPDEELKNLVNAYCEDDKDLKRVFTTSTYLPKSAQFATKVGSVWQSEEMVGDLRKLHAELFDLQWQE